MGISFHHSPGNGLPRQWVLFSVTRRRAHFALRPVPPFSPCSFFFARDARTYIISLAASLCVAVRGCRGALHIKGKGEETPRETKRDTHNAETDTTTAAHASQLIINHVTMLNATEMRAPAVAGSSS